MSNASNGWRACIDHIIRPDSPCPVCEIEAKDQRIALALDAIDLAGEVQHALATRLSVPDWKVKVLEQRINAFYEASEDTRKEAG